MRRDSEGLVELGAASIPSNPWPENWSARAVISALEPLVHDSRRERLQQVVRRRLSSVTALLDAPHDPHNGAAVLRTCDAFGVQEVHVVPHREPFLVSRVVARGAKRWVDVLSHPSPQGAAAALSEAGFELIATHPDGQLEPDELADIPRVCLVFGNEHQGISPELEAAARRTVRIPMRGFVESLNLSVSAAVLLAAATRHRAGDLPAARREALYARWLFGSVSRAAAVLGALAPPATLDGHSSAAASAGIDGH